MAKLTNKILFIATVFSHLAAFHKPFMLMLQEKGYEVHAAASRSSGRMEEIDELGIHCWDVPFARSPFGQQNLAAIKVLKNLLGNHHYELIHVHTPVAAFLGRYLTKRLDQGAVLYTAHGFHFFKGAPLRNWLLYYPSERLASRWTDALIVMNDEDLEIGKKIGFRLGSNLFNVHGVGVDLNDFIKIPPSQSIKPRLGVPNKSLVVTCIAELIPRKNHRLLLDAWKHVIKDFSDAQLLLVGAGALRDELEVFVREEQILNVNFLGYRRDVPDILRISDVVTLVSKHEGLPRCIMEAMAAGKPVVVSDVRGSRDLVRHGVNGFKVPLENNEGLVRAITILLQNERVRNEMGLKSKEMIQGYSIEHVLKEMEKIYDRFLPNAKV